MDERQAGGLWCHEVLELLETYVAGRLTPSELAAVQAHTGECDACARFGTAYAQLVGTLQQLEPEDLDPARSQRLLSRLQQERA